MAHRFHRRWSPEEAVSSATGSATNLSTDSSQLPSSRFSTSRKTRKKGAKPLQPAASQAPLPLAFGCLFIPEFAVWAARFNDPLLNLRPVLVHRRGRVLSASAECLAAGLRIDWTLARAQSFCPQARVLAHDPAEVAYAWEEVLRGVYDLTPRIESVRPGLAFFEPPSANSCSWLSVMAALSRTARDHHAQISIATDRALAELAAHLVRPGTLRPIRAKAQEDFLGRVPVSALHNMGLSEYALERLQWFGLRTVADLRRLSRAQIACQFADANARSDAALLWRFARTGTEGAERQPVQTYQPAPVRRARLAFEQAATCEGEWNAALKEVVEQAAGELNGMGAGALRLTVETRAGIFHGNRLLRESVSSPHTLHRVARELLLAQFSPQEAKSKGTEIQAIEIVLAHLCAHGNQSTLFDTTRLERACGVQPEVPCPPRLKGAVENIESRFPQTMWRFLLQDKYATLPEERYVVRPAVSP